MASRPATATWLTEARTLILESYSPPLYPDLEYEPDRLVATMRSLNADTVRFGAIGYWANYPSKRFPVHPGLGDRDLVRETIDACRAAGLRCVVYLPLSHPMIEPALDSRAHWLQRTESGDRHECDYHVGDFARPYMWYICSRGPYRAAAAEITREIVEGYDVDGMYFDGPHYYRPCYCEGCRESFKEYCGSELPSIRMGQEYALDWNDPAIPAYFRWIGDTDHDVLQEQLDVIRSVRPDLPVLSHGGPVLHTLYKQPHQRLLEQVDGTLFETGSSLVHRHLIAGLTRSAGRLMWSYTGGYNNHPRIVGQGVEWALEGFSSLSIGGSPLISAGGRFYYDTRGSEHVREVYDFQQEHRELYAGLEPEPFLALPYSQATAERFTHADPINRYNHPWTAAHDLLQSVNLQTNPVFETVLDSPERLSEYRVLYLPNVAVLTPSQRENVRAYVANGGGLIAAGITAATDPELYGVEVRSDEWAGHDVYLDVPDSADATIPGLAQGGLLPVQRHALVAAHDEASVLATLQRGWASTSYPGIVARRHGDGRVVYLAGAPEDAFVGWIHKHDPSVPGPLVRQRMGYDHLPELARLMAAAVRWACREQLPYELDADPDLLVVLARKGGAKVLSLINLSGPRYESGRCVLDHVRPRRDVRVRVRARADASFRLLRAGVVPRTVRHGDYVEVVVPELTTYEAVLVH
ncbi:beta-galactosidase trimerization domain-containing protein [Tenggerimyces flavus]|uniref:Beta-galactosidase trimerization domain-containing protein n=1 Tax=Tenggerimyces flavus TaxID=1708749 RepID=A0ABV7YMV2_9ACTN|nr:alpha-amylase family protein [Tenggerimyces flavus]MBM7789653.1 hypothetical protein [Tenggerimyces flavus]